MILPDTNITSLHLFCQVILQPALTLRSILTIECEQLEAVEHSRRSILCCLNFLLSFLAMRLAFILQDILNILVIVSLIIVLVGSCTKPVQL